MFLHKAVITSSQTIAFLNHFVMTPRAHYLIISSPYHFDLMSVTLPRPPPQQIHSVAKRCGCCHRSQLTQGLDWEQLVTEEQEQLGSYCSHCMISIRINRISVFLRGLQDQVRCSASEAVAEIPSKCAENHVLLSQWVIMNTHSLEIWENKEPDHLVAKDNSDECA